MRVSHQKGDTLIEVILAVAVFSMVAVGAIAMMNQGVAAVQRSLEITLVRAQMDGQAEALRYIHQNMVARNGTGEGVWAAVMNEAVDSAEEYDLDENGQCPAMPSQAFVIDPAHINVPGEVLRPVEHITDATAPPYSQLHANEVGAVTGYGLWVETVPDSLADPVFVDFHIRACWNTVGQRVPISLGTIVRLHVPN